LFSDVFADIDPDLDAQVEFGTWGLQNGISNNKQVK
jgi:hypothetical protein